MIVWLKYPGPMAFNCLAATAVYKCSKLLAEAENWTAVDFGNQRYHAGEPIIKHIMKEKNFRLPLPDDHRWRKAFHTSDFFELLGFQRYLAIDLNTEFGSIIMDLNYICKDKYNFTDEFDLVINNGTGEHIFDQMSVFQNMHNMAKVGGLILNVLPLMPCLNHGFYNYNPVLFRDLAIANGYEWGFFWTGHSRGNKYEYDPHSNDVWEQARGKKNPFDPPYNVLEKNVYKGLKEGHVYVVSCYKKTSQKEFVKPLQGRWIASIDKNEAPDIAESYKQPDTRKISNS